jgi:hypothetical protein
MENTDLTALTNEELEQTANIFLLSGDIDGEEDCLLEMLRRRHFPIAWLDELLQLQA